MFPSMILRERCNLISEFQIGREKSANICKEVLFLLHLHKMKIYRAPKCSLTSILWPFSRKPYLDRVDEARPSAHLSPVFFFKCEVHADRIDDARKGLGDLSWVRDFKQTRFKKGAIV